MEGNFSPRRLSLIVEDLADWGVKVPSERGDTIEMENMVLRMKNPLDRVCTEEWRKMNIGFAIVDAISHIVGDNRLAPLTQFVPGFSRFSTNGRTIDGSYGERIHTNNQLEMLIDMLKRNPDSRRAVLTIYMGPVDLAGGGGLNTPCTLNLHFLVRNDKLNMKVMMRSNDVMLGLTNDVFTFTMLQEYVASQLSIPLGDYTHFASSFHLYVEDLKKFHVTKGSNWPSTMDYMPQKWNPTKLYDELCKLSKTPLADCVVKEFDSNYDRDLYLTAALVYHRREQSCSLVWQEIGNSTLKRVAGFWIGR